ncbi:MAG: ABC transporter permease [Chloroflexi bacterium]|nr:ABC transporter permease [Chloroflexota bacterium]
MDTGLDFGRTVPRVPAWLTLPVGVGAAIIIVWVAVAITVSWWAPYEPLATVGTRLTSPTWRHLAGTDALGRDVLTRTLYGTRSSLPIAAIVIAVAVIIGCVVGAVAGMFGGWVDSLLMRLSDITLAFPPILLAMTVTASLGPGLRNALFAMVVVWWPVYARLLRAQVMAVKEQDHVTAATSMGAGQGRILIRHVLPLAMTPILVNATMDFGQVVLLAASLSFIGLGALPPSPEWGSMISEGSVRFYEWWIAAAPGVAILTVVLGFNFLGDGVRDFLDPRTRRR